MQTTLNEIRKCSPCQEGWEKLLRHLGKKKADDEPVKIATIIDSNGIDDAIWCLKAVKGHDREIRLFAVWCARQVQHLMTDQRSIEALQVAEDFANGSATQEQLDAAWAAAWAAARDSAWAAARAAAWDAAKDSAWAAVRDAAGDSAWAAVRDAAGDSAWAAARDAAGDSAWAAARDAAGDSAGDSAWDAARAAQEKRLREICAECDEAEKASS